MKSSALCHHPLTKKRWNPEHLVSVLLIPLHCEGKAFSWELSKYHSSASCCKDFLHGGRGVCVCARLCAYVCMCVLLCVCMCVSVFVGGQENRSKLGSQWLREVTGAPRQPLLARCESARARRAAISLGLVTRKGKNSQRPRSQSCFAILASPRALPWGVGGSPASHSGTEGGLALSGCFRSRPSATARSQKGPTGFCALVRGWFA